jgi:hypothetical protein
MNRLILLLLIGTVALVSGCVEPPQRLDPFASLSKTNPAYVDLTLGLIYSDNTKNALEYANKYSRSHGPGEAQQVFTDIAAVFQQNFKAVVNIKKVEDAKAINADLVAVLDIYAKFPNVNWFDDAKISVSSVFLTIDNKQVEIVKIESVGTPDLDMERTTRKALNQAIKELDAALRGSVKLAEFSKTKAATIVAAKPQAPPAPIAPAPRVIFSDIDNPSFEVAAKLMGDDDIAVVIGVEKYQDLPASDFSAKDAKLVKDYLASLGVRERNIELLLNERATQSSIRKSLESWLPNRVKKDSKVFVYYSGHGAPDPASGEAYLVPHDGDANYLSTTGYPLKTLYEKLGALPAGEVVVVLDACFSGAGGRSVLAKGARPLVVVAEGPRLTPNMAVLAATQGTQISTSSPEKGHGILTYYFLKAIKDGKKDLAEIYSAIKPLVEDEAKLLNVAQTPSLNPDPSRLQGRFRLRK